MKFETSLKTLGFAVMMAAAGVSQATTTDWGTVAPGTTFSTSFSAQESGAFSDSYDFSLLTSATGALKRSVTLTLDESFSLLSGFTGLTYGLYSAATNSLISSTYDAATKTYNYGSLGAGAYYLKVSGTGWSDPGVAAPYYNGSLAITASVPEPQTYAMFLAGLGIVGTVIRRRSHSI